ncbi:hypothetical protein, partial [Paradevosia shaoguanensis]
PLYKRRSTNPKLEPLMAIEARRTRRRGVELNPPPSSKPKIARGLQPDRPILHLAFNQSATPKSIFSGTEPSKPRWWKP